MSASIKRLALVALLSLLATAARSDGVGSFDNNRGIFGSFQSFGGAGTVTPPVLTNLRITNTGAFRITNTGANRAVFP